ncbi:MAG: divalent-cation tolerance protein CutA [Kiritimatiellae bacterium]|nr:divalent-cation tolerance protein CutA [Kiritimatiellia bacterium]
MRRRNACVLVTTTVNSRAEALRLARKIVGARLAACVQWMPISSIYWWKHKMEEAKEYLLVAKTRRTHADKLICFIRSEHVYELPEVTICPIEGGLREYLDWIASETRPVPSSGKTHKT